ncbi:class I SAM-dependent methyltransferase [Thermodesulfobacteriota bacterium]
MRKDNVESQADDVISTLELMTHNKDKLARCVRLVEDFCGPGSKILEIGCAHGKLLNKLKRKGFEVHGIELSRGATSIGKKKFGIDILTLPVEDEIVQTRFQNYFDAVLCFDTIEHVQHPSGFLRASAALLKMGGVFIVSTPNRLSFFGKLGRLLYLCGIHNNYFLGAFYNTDHVQIFTPNNLERLFIRNGMIPVRREILRELSYPLDYYHSVVRSKHGWMASMVAAFFSSYMLRFGWPKNKMYMVCRKK